MSDDNRLKKAIDRPLQDEWRCRGCGNLLGVLDEEGEVLRIKYKDFYCSVYGGAIEIICRKCALPNTMGYVDPKKVKGFTTQREEKIKSKKD